ncbi:MAG TPA: hypothetical protein VNA13_03550 [Xanthomonadales bacterium]|nr:hypothetical protein [Xanthomonadales bacterium]
MKKLPKKILIIVLAILIVPFLINFSIGAFVWVVSMPDRQCQADFKGIFRSKQEVDNLMSEIENIMDINQYRYHEHHDEPNVYSDPLSHKCRVSNGFASRSFQIQNLTKESVLKNHLIMLDNGWESAERNYIDFLLRNWPEFEDEIVYFKSNLRVVFSYYPLPDIHNPPNVMKSGSDGTRYNFNYSTSYE